MAKTPVSVLQVVATKKRKITSLLEKKKGSKINSFTKLVIQLLHHPARTRTRARTSAVQVPIYNLKLHCMKAGKAVMKHFLPKNQFSKSTLTSHDTTIKLNNENLIL